MIINPVFEDDLQAVTIDHPALGEITVYDLIFTRLNQIADPGVTFDPFQGPVYDRKGNLRIPEGMWPSAPSSPWSGLWTAWLAPGRASRRSKVSPRGRPGGRPRFSLGGGSRWSLL